VLSLIGNVLSMPFASGRLILFSLLFPLSLLSACTPERLPPEPLRLSSIVIGAEPIEDGKPLPTFGQYFAEGVEILYVYAQFENMRTLTGSVHVMMDWYVPNDFHPPTSRTRLELQPPQNVAQFSLHRRGGMGKTPHMVIIRAGENPQNLTESGSMRFFTGMTTDEARKALEEEASKRVREEREP
jgi:hypothetical protein